MKKFIAIIFALITALLATPNRGVDPSPVAVVNPPQTAITTQVEQVPEESETTAETALVSEKEEAEAEAETAEITADWNEMLPPETEEHEVKEQEENAEYIDEGNQNLVEYKPQIGGQPNPFDNDIPTEIDDRPVEDYVGEGEDRPGEGIHF